MVREILPPSNPSDTAPTPPAQTPLAPAATVQHVAHDALAGALPSWDLLPASPFVRRIK
ncbi:hypothetical protein N5J07_09260 [Comamonas aquatica]|uniref:hypothetical protein n=1 Tax=Comamonas aquatica TaxID=225991 RepID=UPI00244A3B71|nr:hypothetical protein [Comamonas aquatica]MDH1379636.1 hypothetical protein [Comamonas aquatica]MDH1639623.1 hypothetical protein [Comamonas aquatica]